MPIWPQSCHFSCTRDSNAFQINLCKRSVETRDYTRRIIYDVAAFQILIFLMLQSLRDGSSSDTLSIFLHEYMHETIHGITQKDYNFNIIRWSPSTRAYHLAYKAKPRSKISIYCIQEGVSETKVDRCIRSIYFFVSETLSRTADLTQTYCCVRPRDHR